MFKYGLSNGTQVDRSLEDALQYWPRKQFELAEEFFVWYVVF